MLKREKKILIDIFIKLVFVRVLLVSFLKKCLLYQQAFFIFPQKFVVIFSCIFAENKKFLKSEFKQRGLCENDSTLLKMQKDI
jgi:hypothetical protein